MGRLISSTQLRAVLLKLGDAGKQMMRDHIMDQREIDGTPFPRLSPVTSAVKRARGGGISGNANMRMRATNDFMKNAFASTVEDEKVVFYISTQPHEFKKSEANRERVLGRLKAGKSVSKRAWAGTQKKDIRYLDIAKWNLRGEYDQGFRRSSNPGANFFGFSEKDKDELRITAVNELSPIIVRNAINEIMNSVK